MTTKLQRLGQAVAQLAAQVAETAGGAAAEPEAAQVRMVGLAQQANALEADVGRLVQKAAETDHDRRTYGPGMAAKVTQLQADWQALKRRVDESYTAILAAIAAKRRRERIAAEAAAAAAPSPGPEPGAAFAAQHATAPAKPEAAVASADPAAEAAAAALQKAHAEHTAEARAAAAAGAAAAAAEAAPGPARPPAPAKAAVPAASEAAGERSQPQQQQQSVQQQAALQVPQQQQQQAASQQKPAQQPASQPAAGQQAAQQAPQAAAAAGEAAGRERQIAAAVARFAGMEQRWQQAAAADAASGLPDGSPLELTGGGPQLLTILQAAQRAGRLVVVDFSAAWCGPCRAMKPVLQQLAAELKGRVAFCVVDCEATAANRSLAAEAAIRAFPTLHIYAGTDRRQALQGGQSAAALRQLLSQHLASAGLAAAGGGASPARLARALAALRRGSDEAALTDACQLLAKLLSNIRDSPGEPKFRRLRASNRRLSGSLLARQGGAECLLALGFAAMHEAGEQVFVGDAIDAAAAAGPLTLLQEAGSHPTAFTRHFVDRVSDAGSSGGAPGSSGSGASGSAAAPAAPGAGTSTEQAMALLAAELAKMLGGVQMPGGPSGGGQG